MIIKLSTRDEYWILLSIQWIVVWDEEV